MYVMYVYLIYTWFQYQTKTSQGEKTTTTTTTLQTSISYEYRCKILQKDSYKQNPAAYKKNYTLWPSGIYLLAKNARLVHHIRIHEYNQFSSVAPYVQLFVTHRLKHARLPCPSPTPGACSSSCSSSWWCHPTILSSVVPFSSCLQSFLASGPFPEGQFFASGGRSFGASASTSVLQNEYSGLISLGLIGLISLQSKGLSRVFNNHSSKSSVLRCSTFFMVQLLHPYMTIGYTWM